MDESTLHGGLHLPWDPSSPMFGRAPQLAALEDALSRVEASSEKQIVTVLGGGGMGKSRIVYEFAQRVRSRASNRTRIFAASAKRQSLSYGVFARLLRARLSLGDGASHAVARAALEREVTRVLGDKKVSDVCHFLGQLMEVPYVDSPLTRAVLDDPVQARVLRRAIFRSFFERDAEASPIVLVFEDLHAVDDDSVDLLHYLLADLTGPILILCTARPELVGRIEGWFEFGAAHHQRLELPPLDDEDASSLMAALLEPCQGGAPEPLIEAAVSMASGNPGMLEQMVRIFLASEVLTPSGDGPKATWKVSVERLASARLPMTPEDAIATRISTLSVADRRVLEHAAAMGSVFWLGAVVALGRMDRDAPEFWRPSDAQDVRTVRAILDDLVRRDYVLKLPDSAFADEEEYVFKHTKEREKLSALTAASTLRLYHQVVADWLSEKENVRSQEEYAAMLAQHLERAGSTTRAGMAYIEAGDIARQTFAAKKAYDYYRSGLELLGDSDARRRIDALHNYGDVLLLLGKSDEAVAAFKEMLRLAYRLSLMSKGGAAHNRMGRFFRETGRLSSAREHLDTSLELFQSVQDSRGIAACHDDIGKLLWFKGDYDAALEQMRTALEMRKQIGDRRSIALSLNNIGLVWMDHGRARKAGEAFEAALAIRREIGDLIGMAESLANLGDLAQDQNDWEQALLLFGEARKAAQEVGERNRVAAILTKLGETYYHLGKTDEAIHFLKQAEELCDELGDKLHLAEAQRGLAKAYLLQGELKRARESIKRAVDLFGQIRTRVHLAVALRTLAEVTAAGAWGDGFESKAIDYFTRSIAICKEIGNELELARSYKAFSDYVARSEHYRQNAEIQQEARVLGEMAEGIFARYRLHRSQRRDSSADLTAQDVALSGEGVVGKDRVR